ncbi:MAG TPA: type VI secretion system accessory protein TagJ [Gemmataceae bacterium]|jgi:type VI secretion system protein ImpE|nr:type VI secretion system accessory protein TagJ [Gemmataceae bacterium]
MTAREAYQAGRLDDAIAAALAEVKQSPADVGRRTFLAELACFAGDLERADRQLDMLGEVAPQATLGLSLFRQLIRAEQARQQFFADGRVPEVVAEPGPTLRPYLEASVLLRTGQAKEATELLKQAEDTRPKVRGVCDGKPFNDFRDLDDLTAAVFEVLTSTGKYYWIPIERVESVEVRPVERVRDLLWRRARMVVRDGPDGEVYLPTLYAGSYQEKEDALRLGRATDWRGGQDSPVRGRGLRTYLVGDSTPTILEIKEMTIGEG